MNGSVYFLQRCPVCGRMLQIKVRYLGVTVRCQHCSGHFLATDPSAVPADASACADSPEHHELPGHWFT